MTRDNQRWYVTSAIPYVNAPPHLGFAHEIVQTDVLARYYRLRGFDVRFVTGSDENSLKNVRAADQLALAPGQLIARHVSRFEYLKKALNLSYDDFIRTSVDIRHRVAVAKLWRACADNGDIYKSIYSGLYCVGCEHYYRESDLENGCCPEHGTVPEQIDEENYFFRLSRYRSRLLALIGNRELQIIPVKRRNEVLRWLEDGLQDISISRSRRRAGGWGIPVPGDPEQVVYVWFDALGNYISALDFGGDECRFERYWRTSFERTHVIGKGVTRFHAIYWPAMLLSAGVALPTRLFVHGYVTVEGRKISKSLDNAVDPIALADEVGVDSLRFYLLRQIRSHDDGDFSRARLEAVYTTDLANGLGNLLSRSVGLVNRYADGRVPHPGSYSDADRRLIEACSRLPGKVESAFEDFRLDAAVGEVWSVIQQANRYVSEVAPWRLAREGAIEEVRTCLFVLVETLRVVGQFVRVFLPASGERLLGQLCSEDDSGDFDTRVGFGHRLGGRPVRPDGWLFPRQF